MKRVTTLLIAFVVAATPALAAQKDVTPAMEAAALKQMAAAVPLGTRVKLQTTSGRRLTATLMAVTDDGVVVKRATRVPEAAVSVPFAELARFERDDKRGMSIGKALGIGLAAGGGAILTLFVIALSISD